MYDMQFYAAQTTLHPAAPAPGGTFDPIRAQLVYCTDDPTAVRLSFLKNGAETVVHRFPRETLVDGLAVRAEFGDVVVEPHAVHPAFIAVTLGQPDAYPFTVHAQRDALTDFVEMTMLIVPDGAELEGVDIDALAGGLLGGEQR